jgi:hypothetical protein
MRLTQEETEQIIVLIEEKVQNLKIERDRLDEYYQQAKRDMGSWGTALSKLETQMLDLRKAIKRIKEDNFDA